MPKFVCILGPTGAGKDTFASQIPNARNIKFSGPCKRLIEGVLRLPQGALNQQETKNLYVTDLTDFVDLDLPPHIETFSDLLVQTWKDSQHTIFSKIWKMAIAGEIMETLDEDLDLVFTDIRNPWEAQLITQMKKSQAPYSDLIVVELKGRGTPLESDRYLKTIIEILLVENPESRYHSVYNMGPVEVLKGEALRMFN